jgi:hypothetical protein
MGKTCTSVGGRGRTGFRRSVAGWRHADGLDHENRRPARGAGAVDRAARNGEGLVRAERDGSVALPEVYQQLTFEDEEELVLVVVLVPYESAFAGPSAQPRQRRAITLR